MATEIQLDGETYMVGDRDVVVRRTARKAMPVGRRGGATWSANWHSIHGEERERVLMAVSALLAEG